jgi:hypothetical protein
MNIDELKVGHDILWDTDKYLTIKYITMASNVFTEPTGVVWDLCLENVNYWSKAVIGYVSIDYILLNKHIEYFGSNGPIKSNNSYILLNYEYEC